MRCQDWRPAISDRSKYLWTKRQKLQQTASQICPGRGTGIGERIPKDSKQRIKHKSRARGVEGHRCSEEKALRLETSGKESAFRPGYNLGSDVDCGRVGLKHRHGHLLRWGQVYLSAYLGCALVVEARLRVEENPKQERPCGRLKAKIRPLVSLPTAKPLCWFYPVARNSAL